MVILSAAVLFAALGVATYPCWSYSRRWGYAPSAATGALLLMLAVATIAGKAPSKAVASLPEKVQLARY